jgi:hypothetical protein
MMNKLAALLLLTASLASVEARRSVTEYEIDLDLPPEQRFTKADGPLSQFNATVWKFWDEYFVNDKVLTDALFAFVALRGKEVPEFELEIEGLAAASGLDVRFVRGVQMLYEIQTLMVPTTLNGSATTALVGQFPEGLEALERFPFRGPGCTGIIAYGPDGTVSHARNLDFSPVPIMTNLVYTGIFTRGGVEVFRSQMVAGYQQLITGYRAGPNGYAIERNTRYADQKKGNQKMFELLAGGNPLNGWQLRKIMEAHDNYDDAIAAIAAAPFSSTEYAIVSGVKKGVILSKAPSSEGLVEYTQTLGQPNFEERSDYIIMTNFDFFDHDEREHFDPTGGFPTKTLFSRRVNAQKLLNSTELNGITPEFLFETINANGVLADTIFQAVINVEKGYWNVSQPDL